VSRAERFTGFGQPKPEALSAPLAQPTIKLCKSLPEPQEHYLVDYLKPKKHRHNFTVAKDLH
jgi:hypothetical protein